MKTKIDQSNEAHLREFVRAFNLTTEPMKTDYIKNRRAAHHAALETLARHRTPVSGRVLWQRLRRIEAEFSRASTAQCNGEAFEGQPYRDEEAWDVYCSAVTERVRKVLGCLPEGFRLNTDPRGYGLKLDPERGAVIPEGMQKDWGQNGILAAEIS